MFLLINKMYDVPKTVLEFEVALFSEMFGSVWYMCLKIKNCCLKIFVEIRVGEKCMEMREMLFKN